MPLNMRLALSGYEACIMGLQVVLGLVVKELEVYGDSDLIIS